MFRYVSTLGLLQLMLILSTCSGLPQTNSHPPPTRDVPPSMDVQLDSPSSDLHAGLVEVLAAETPAGVDEELFSALKDALAAVIQERISCGDQQRVASWTPSGPGSMVNNLVINGDGPYWVSWTYRNKGDYDLNGETNIADLTRIGLYFGKTTTDPIWLTARTADGDGNGEINISDITPIGMNYGSTVAGYRLWGVNDLIDEWSFVADIPVSMMLQNADQPCFRGTIENLDYTYYRLWTYDNSEFEGGWSNFHVVGHPEESTIEGLFEYIQ